MKALKYGFGLILVGGFALTASCGGSSDDSSSPSGGTSSTTGGTSSTGAGTTGNPTGGTTGNPTGGTGNPTGGTTGNPTGGTGNPTGGTGTTAGTGGTGTGGTGTGGAPTNPAGCPAATPTPKNGDACTIGMNNRTETCAYPATDAGEVLSCTCQAPRRGGGNNGQAGAADEMDTLANCQTRCAARTSTPPADGSPCTGNLTCPFGGGMGMVAGASFCQCRMNTWTCTTLGGMGQAGAAN